MGSSDVQFAEAIHCFARSEVVQLVQLAHLDLAILQRGIGETPGPFERLFARLDLNERVPGDELLRLGEGTVDQGALLPGVFDAPALRAGLESRGVEQDAGPL